VTRLPAVRARELIRFFEAHGFLFDRQTGSHCIMVRLEPFVIASIPQHKGKTLGRGLVADILKDAGFSTSDFIEWKKPK
jgi:predicted RNA binding protein YcfA (HicA-like mRNA interferase family)